MLGLEADWACVTWDADLRLVDGGWRHHSFQGDVWTNVNKPEWQRYLLNAYRVLLDKQGKFVVNPSSRRPLVSARGSKFSEGLAAVHIGDYKTGKWGYISR